MGSRDIVYGYIEQEAFGREGSLEAQHCSAAMARNIATIASLPQHDAWPPITRDFFAFSPNDPSCGGYRAQVIHFGGAFSSIWEVWSEYLAKVEGLLSRMIWTTVLVRLETQHIGAFCYRWNADDEWIAAVRSGSSGSPKWSATRDPNGPV